MEEYFTTGVAGEMKTFATAILLLVFSITPARAQSPRVILVPLETAVKTRATVSFDVFVYNDSPKPVKIPPIELFSAVYSLRGTSGNTLPRVETSAKIASHPPQPHTLGSKAGEHRTIKMEIPAEPGELVEVYIEIGRETVLRSNTVLLYCSLEESGSQQMSSPKASTTP